MYTHYTYLISLDFTWPNGTQCQTWSCQQLWMTACYSICDQIRGANRFKMLQISLKTISTVDKFPMKSLGLWPGGPGKLTRDSDSAQAALRVASIETLRTTFRTEPFWMPQIPSQMISDDLRWVKSIATVTMWLGKYSEPCVFSCDISQCDIPSKQRTQSTASVALHFLLYCMYEPTAENCKAMSGSPAG